MIKVSKIEYLGGYRLRLRFNDDAIGDFDFTTVVNEHGSMVEPLHDVDYFRRVFLEFGAPTWPNGFDVAPAWLYREIDASGMLKRPAHA